MKIYLAFFRLVSSLLISQKFREKKLKYLCNIIKHNLFFLSVIPPPLFNKLRYEMTEFIIKLQRSVTFVYLVST